MEKPAGSILMDDREAAALAGRTTYHGAPCRHGHGNERYVRDNKCVQCVRQRVRDRDARYRRLLDAAKEA